MPQNRRAAELDYWEGEFDKLRRSQLQTVQTAADNWSKVVAALLGLFGTVAFTGALTTIDKLPTDRDSPVIPADTLVGDLKIMVVVAFGLSLVALILVSLAAGDIFPQTRTADGPTKLRDRSIDSKARALCLLRWGQALGIVAALIVLAGSLVVFLTPDKEAPAKASTVIAVTAKGVFCGQLQGSATDPIVAGHALDASAHVSSITPVDTCPGK